MRAESKDRTSRIAPGSPGHKSFSTREAILADCRLGSHQFASIPRARRAHLFGVLSGVALFSLLLSGCPLYNPAAFIQHKSEPQDVLSTAAQIALEWDPPASGASNVANYIVSYRIHGASTWNTLATVPASATPSYVVLHSAIGNGSFDFAVVAVDSSGNSSPLHTSLDPTADPSSGWYLSWGQ